VAKKEADLPYKWMDEIISDLRKEKYLWGGWD
jgi:hypothetical protein